MAIPGTNKGDAMGAQTKKPHALWGILATWSTFFALGAIGLAISGQSTQKETHFTPRTEFVRDGDRIKLDQVREVIDSEVIEYTETLGGNARIAYAGFGVVAAVIAWLSMRKAGWFIRRSSAESH